MKFAPALVVAALFVAGCGTISSAQSVTNWLNQSAFSRAHHTLISDTTRAERLLATSNSSAAELHTVCGILTIDAASAGASLPTPDPQGTKLLATAYETMSAGSKICYGAAMSSSQRSQAVDLLRKSLPELSFAALRLAVASTRG